MMSGVKTGGQSFNTRPGSKRGVTTSYRCSFCSRQYKMEWAKNNHEKICATRIRKQREELNKNE